jgi:hypothetical protein
MKKNRKKKKIKDGPYEILVNTAFIRLLHCSPEILIWIARQAASYLPIEFWNRNEYVVEHHISDALDCFHIAIGDYNRPGEEFDVEVTPYPRGMLTFGIKGYAETYATIDEEDSIVIDYDIISNLPEQSSSELFMPFMKQDEMERFDELFDALEKKKSERDEI